MQMFKVMTTRTLVRSSRGTSRGLLCAGFPHSSVSFLFFFLAYGIRLMTWDMWERPLCYMLQMKRRLGLVLGMIWYGRHLFVISIWDIVYELNTYSDFILCPATVDDIASQMYFFTLIVEMVVKLERFQELYNTQYGRANEPVFA